MSDNKMIIEGIPSSFVFSTMKLAKDAGAGEAKLFVGGKTKDRWRACCCSSLVRRLAPLYAKVAWVCLWWHR